MKTKNKRLGAGNPPKTRAEAEDALRTTCDAIRGVIRAIDRHSGSRSIERRCRVALERLLPRRNFLTHWLQEHRNSLRHLRPKNS